MPPFYCFRNSALSRRRCYSHLVAKSGGPEPLCNFDALVVRQEYGGQPSGLEVWSDLS
ncbi:BnaA03g17710D [Brassica napus]|uniref:Uncharacterized protein n=2 Tax=Brassica TaxID=3705 RepID=M4C773_BRACM|nr:unnamed protein product [Brassica napus]CDY07740.1 BnaA03g17710D [Brassica napus]